MSGLVSAGAGVLMRINETSWMDVVLVSCYVEQWQATVPRTQADWVSCVTRPQAEQGITEILLEGFNTASTASTQVSKSVMRRRVKKNDICCYLLVAIYTLICLYTQID